MRISRLLKRLRRWSSQAFRKRYLPAAFRTCRNADNSVLTAERTTSKGRGSISCEVEFCIFYRLSLRILGTKDVLFKQRFTCGTSSICLTLRMTSTDLFVFSSERLENHMEYCTVVRTCNL
jgi:hypothetical protein